MIEKIVLDYLETCLSVPVYMEEPEEPDDTYVLVEKLGGGYDEGLSTAHIAIQSYSDSLYKAAGLNVIITSAMKRITDLDSIAKISLNSDYNYTDTTTKRYGYQAIFDLIYYEEDTNV